MQDHELSAKAAFMMRAFGVRRSGQHAIINWIIRNSGQDDYVFLNNCRYGESPVSSAAQCEINGTWERGLESLKRAPFVMISYERGYLPAALSGGGFKEADFAAEILITRSFVNWLPSYIKMIRQINAPLPADGLDNLRHISKGIQHYKDHLMATQHSNKPDISFDSWFASPAYRRQKLAALGLPVVDDTLGQVQRFGGGSSFSGALIAAEKLEVLARWRQLEHDTFALNILHTVQEDAAFMAALAQSYPEDIGIIDTLLA